mmetsp:Transcript_1439/g.3244  ORF Transcript_1439/g.3244 Transcript_1439/m.3244 type:complete len:240 (+) Transcript_1439:628-1347(+)
MGLQLQSLKKPTSILLIWRPFFRHITCRRSTQPSSARTSRWKVIWASAASTLNMSRPLHLMSRCGTSLWSSLALTLSPGPLWSCQPPTLLRCTASAGAHPSQSLTTLSSPRPTPSSPSSALRGTRSLWLQATLALATLVSSRVATFCRSSPQAVLGSRLLVARITRQPRTAERQRGRSVAVGSPTSSRGKVGRPATLPPTSATEHSQSRSTSTRRAVGFQMSRHSPQTSRCSFRTTLGR